MSATDAVMAFVSKLDTEFVRVLSKHSFTASLIQNPVSKLITKSLFVAFVILFWYELLYWSGIHLGLWEYHAKDIFKEVPVHCAHVYVRLNIAQRQDVEKVRSYYRLKQESTYNILKWKNMNEKSVGLFELNQFVKYHFEFSPEDFEKNPDPELGSTIEHLREKTLATFLNSSIRSRFYKDLEGIVPSDVMIFNNNALEVKADQNKTYLSNINIETGNVIDSVILI